MPNHNSSTNYNQDFELVTGDQAKLTFAGGLCMTKMLVDADADDRTIDFGFAFAAVQDQVLTLRVLTITARRPCHEWDVQIWMVEDFGIEKFQQSSYLQCTEVKFDTHLQVAPQGENGNRLGNGSMSSGDNPENEFMSSGLQNAAPRFD